MKVSIRIYEDRAVRAIWDDENSKWWFSVIDIIGVLNQQDDYNKNRNYWKYLKTKLRKDDAELVSATNQLKLLAPDGKIHSYLFGGLYEFAGHIRTVNIAKGGFQFAMVQFLPQTLADIERMPQFNYDQIVSKYVEMNIAHPFREGNGRATRIWLDLMLKNSLGLCVDWSQINKNTYLDAMTKSVADDSAIRELLKSALTDKINDREMFMKGIDYSYYYEESE